MNAEAFKEGYGALLKGFLETQEEQYLVQAADLCHELEIAGRKEEWSDIERLTPQLRSSLAPVKDYLNG